MFVIVFSAFQQFLDGFVERLCRLDDVVVLPESGVAEKVDLVEEGIALVEGVASLDGLHVLVGAARHSHFAVGGERSGEESSLPVAVEAERVAQVADACL